MKKNFYLPRAEEERVPWFNNFAVKLPLYANKYSITPEELMDMQQSAPFYAALNDAINQHRNFQSAMFKYRDDVRDGTKNGGTLQPLTMPMINLPMPVAPGIFVRVKAIVNRIKANINYSEADGNDLGIEGTITTVDTTTTKPVIKVRIGDGGHPEILWTKQNFEAIEIYKQEADGTWKLLAIDLQPNYTDLSALPEVGKSAVWSYRAIYRLKDKQVGQWSDVVSVTVTG